MTLTLAPGRDGISEMLTVVDTGDPDRPLLSTIHSLWGTPWLRTSWIQICLDGSRQVTFTDFLGWHAHGQGRKIVGTAA